MLNSETGWKHGAGLAVKLTKEEKFILMIYNSV